MGRTEGAASRLKCPGGACFIERRRLSNRLAGDFRRPGLVAPFPAEELATMLCDYGRYPHHTHDEENREEDNCNHEDWHTAPLAPLCVAVEPASVMAITSECEEESLAV